MTSRILALLVLLLAPTPESESVHLRRFFEEHWATRLRESPEFAETGQMDEGEHQARLALVGQEGHAVLLCNLAQVLARFPDDRRDRPAGQASRGPGHLRESQCRR